MTFPRANATAATRWRIGGPLEAAVAAEHLQTSPCLLFAAWLKPAGGEARVLQMQTRSGVSSYTMCTFPKRASERDVEVRVIGARRADRRRLVVRAHARRPWNLNCERCGRRGGVRPYATLDPIDLSGVMQAAIRQITEQHRLEPNTTRPRNG